MPTSRVLLCLTNETKERRESICRPFHAVSVMMILKTLILSPNYNYASFPPQIFYRFFKSSVKIKDHGLKQSFTKKLYGEVIKRENLSKKEGSIFARATRNPLASTGFPP